MVVNNMVVNQNEVMDFILLISSHHPRVLMCTLVTFNLFSFSLLMVYVFLFLTPLSTTL